MKLTDRKFSKGDAIFYAIGILIILAMLFYQFNVMNLKVMISGQQYELYSYPYPTSTYTSTPPQTISPNAADGVLLDITAMLTGQLGNVIANHYL